jgi:hypothetical protein
MGVDIVPAPQGDSGNSECEIDQYMTSSVFMSVFAEQS